MPESPKTYALPKSLAALAVFGGLGSLLWPRLDQAQSRIVLVGTVLTIALAFYSIFDLQKQRKEKFWHTLDRLLRAAFVAITLVFVVEIAFTPPPDVGQGDTIYEKADPLSLADELNALEKSWTVANVEPVLQRHFARLGAMRQTTLVLAVGERAVRFRTDGSSVSDIEVK